MNASDVITKCDRIKPNVYSYAQKREWINKIESDIRRFAAMHTDTNADLTFTMSENPKLMLDECDSDIYVYYLISMIDLSNQEYILYNNSSTFFNSQFSVWKKKWRSNHKPLSNIPITM